MRDNSGRFASMLSHKYATSMANKRRAKIYWDSIKVPALNNSLAWCLGVVASDGYLVERSKRVNFHCKDRELLLKIKCIVKNGGSVHKTKRGYYFFGTGQWFYLLCNQYRIYPDKTFNLKFPKFDNMELYKHFIRGFLDGDGSVSCLSKRVAKRNYSSNSPVRIDFTCASISFIKGLRDFLHKNIGLRNVSIIKPGNWFRIYYAHYDSVGLGNYLYSGIDCSIFLERKFDVIKDWIEA